MRDSKAFAFPAFVENEGELFVKILKVSLDLDKDKLASIIKFLAVLRFLCLL